MNMEGEGLGEVNEYYRKQLVGMSVLQPNEEEREAIEAAANQPQEPDPQTMFLASEALKNESVAELNSAKALEIASKVDKTVAEIDNVDADTALKEAETLAQLRELRLPVVPSPRI
jgi:hypothetical protein